MIERRRFHVVRAVLMGILVLSVLPGCALKEWLHRKPVARQRALPRDATLEAIADHINEERAGLIGWRSTDVRITATGEGLLAPRLNATLAVQSPKNLRMVASSVAGPEVDFGSNNERFWFWMKRQEPKVILTGSHDGLGRQQVLPIPFPPDWLMEALSVLPIDANTMTLERDSAESERVRLVNQFGKVARRVLIVDLFEGAIVEHQLYDSNNQVVAIAKLSDFRQQPNGTTLPHVIELSMPETKSALTLQIGRIDVNSSMPESTWEMQEYPKYEIVDLDKESGSRLH